MTAPRKHRTVQARRTLARLAGTTVGDQSVRWNGRTSDLPTHEQYCTCCERPLTAAHRMLELDQRTQTYHDFRDVPEDRSQGWFPFGLTCARKLVAGEAKRRESSNVAT